MPQQIETPCTKCFLHKKCYTVGMQGKVPEGEESRLKIFVDHPSQEDDMRHEFGEGRTSQFLVWLMRRLSIPDKAYEIRYTIKCAPPKNALPNNERKWECIDACSPLRFANLQNPPYTIITMGEISCMAFLHESIKKRVHCMWRSPESQLQRSKVFVAYAPGYGLKSPAEAVSMSRLLWSACEAAGFHPKVNLKLKDFDFQVI